MASAPDPRRRLTFETRVLVLALGAGGPAALIALLLLWFGDYSARVVWTLTLVVIFGWFTFAFAVRERVVRPLQTVSNLLAALLEGDYSIRSRSSQADDALGLAMQEVNALSRTLREQRLGALEATALLRKVMEEIEVAVFAFDSGNRLRLVNRAGERLLGEPAERATGRAADALGLADYLDGEPLRTVNASFGGIRGRWEIRRSMFRQGGLPHQLLVITDVSRTLREEELLAWQRLIRVLSHEINNSLAPIKSIAGSLQNLLRRQPRPDDLDQDIENGLRIIAGRSDALSRFMSSYARLARLPAPKLAPVDVRAWIQRAVDLETRMTVQIEPGPDIVIMADGDQLDQLLINLLRNAVDASLETGGSVVVGWARENDGVTIHILDEGPGLPDPANLFVPFFTTKPNGTGIGLTLSRQITEAHRGSLNLVDRADRTGCEAVLWLPG